MSYDAFHLYCISSTCTQKGESFQSSDENYSLRISFEVNLFQLCMDYPYVIVINICVSIDWSEEMCGGEWGE